MRRRRWIWWSVPGLLAAGALAYATSSHWRADRFRERIQAALQDSLRRPVKIGGPVTYSVFGGPGFEVEDVTIADAPEFGTEPLAYVTRLEGHLRLTSLLSRNWQFAALRLIDPSFNLAQDAHGSWNIQPLLEQRRSTVIPIEVRGARINFRGEDRKKSPFYLTNARADVNVSSGDNALVTWRFEGQPARTDKGEQGFGQFSGNGRWQNSELLLDMQLERSAISELVTLTQGQSYGVQGLLASKVRFSGPIHNLQVNGQVQLEEVTRWALLPQLSNPRFTFSGRVDLPGQRVELQTAAPTGGGQPLGFQLRGANVMQQPRWAATVTLQELPLASVLPVAKRLGQSVPDALQMQGVMTGVVGYSASSGLQGQVVAKDVSLQISRSEPFLAKEAMLLLNGNTVQLQPVELINKSSRGIQLAADYRTNAQALAIKVKGETLPVADLQTALDSLGIRSVPVLRQCAGGTWSGSAEYLLDGTPAGKWIGDGVIADTTVALPGAVDALSLQRAAVRIDGDRVVVSGMDAKLGALRVQGEYRYEPGDVRPHQLRVAVPDADAAEVERLFVPAAPKPKGFLARTLKFGDEGAAVKTVSRQVEGTVRFGLLRLGALELTEAQSRFTLDRGLLDLPAISARWQTAPLTGALQIDLRAEAPAYRLRAKAQKMRWHGGQWDIDGELEASGLGPELFTTAAATGSFEGRGGDIVQDMAVRTVSGQFVYPQKKGEPAVKLSHLQVTVGRDVYRGDGTAVWPGKIEAQLTNSRKQLQLSGSVSPWQVQATGPAAVAVR